MRGVILRASPSPLIKSSPHSWEVFQWQYFTNEDTETWPLHDQACNFPTNISYLAAATKVQSASHIYLVWFWYRFFFFLRQCLLTLWWVLIEPSSCLQSRCIKSLSTIEKTSTRISIFFLQFFPDMVITDHLELCMLKYIDLVGTDKYNLSDFWWPKFTSLDEMI